MALLEMKDLRSISPLRWVGYGLLFLALLDTIAIVFPPRLTDPAWEIQAIGALVERVPVPLLGFALVFFTGSETYSKAEKALLAFLSWLCLLIGLGFFLLIPLGISDFFRVNQQTNTQIQGQSSQQIARLNQVQQQVNQATATELQNLTSRLNRQPAAPAPQPQALKQQLLSQLNKAKARVKAEAQATQTARRNSLLKNVVKWLLGALVAGTLFIYIWKITAWARRSQKKWT